MKYEAPHCVIFFHPLLFPLICTYPKHYVLRHLVLAWNTEYQCFLHYNIICNICGHIPHVPCKSVVIDKSKE